MSRQRYEPVPQREQREEVIILDSIHNSPHYNYNSAVPNSVSSHTPSIAPSIPDSPPPSFHTHSPPGTPRPTPSTSTRRSVGGASYAELWGVAPSTVGGLETEIGETSNDALATITSLKQRVEWLEESIGKLLIERDSHVCSDSSAAQSQRDNCCVTFSDASPDLERMITQGKGSNCCVRFKKHNVKKEENRRAGALVTIGGVLVMLLVLIITLNSGYARAGPRGKLASENVVDIAYDEERS